MVFGIFSAIAGVGQAISFGSNITSAACGVAQFTQFAQIAQHAGHVSHYTHVAGHVVETIGKVGEMATRNAK